MFSSNFNISLQDFKLFGGIYFTTIQLWALKYQIVHYGEWGGVVK